MIHDTGMLLLMMESLATIAGHVLSAMKLGGQCKLKLWNFFMNDTFNWDVAAPKKFSTTVMH